MTAVKRFDEQSGVFTMKQAKYKPHKSASFTADRRAVLSKGERTINRKAQVTNGVHRRNR